MQVLVLCVSAPAEQETFTFLRNTPLVPNVLTEGGGGGAAGERKKRQRTIMSGGKVKGQRRGGGE